MFSTQLEVSGSGAEQFLESVMVADLKNLHVNTGRSVGTCKLYTLVIMVYTCCACIVFWFPSTTVYTSLIERVINLVTQIQKKTDNDTTN